MPDSELTLLQGTGPLLHAFSCFSGMVVRDQCTFTGSSPSPGPPLLLARPLVPFYHLVMSLMILENHVSGPRVSHFPMGSLPMAAHSVLPPPFQSSVDTAVKGGLLEVRSEIKSLMLFS